MRMDFAEAGFEELRRAHEQLKAEHQAILATSQSYNRSAGNPRLPEPS